MYSSDSRTLWALLGAGGRWGQLLVKLLSYQLVHGAHVGAHGSDMSPYATWTHYHYHGLGVLSSEPRVISEQPDMDTRAGPGLGRNGCDHMRPRSHNMLLKFLSWLPDLIRYVLHIYTLQTRHRKQVSDKNTFSKHFYVSGMLCGKWGFDKSGNCVRVPTLVGSVSSDFLFDNNRLQSLSVFAPHLNYSLHKNIS